MIKLLGIGCGVMVLLVIIMVGVVPAFLDKEYDSETSLLINAEPSAIYPLISDLQEWQKWCPWTPEQYPEIESTFSGEPGVGNEWTWTDPSGDGRMVIVTADPETGVHCDLYFGEFKSECRVTMTKATNGAEVAMALKGELSWIQRLAKSAMDAALKQEFDGALKKLKSVVESDPSESSEEAPK